MRAQLLVVAFIECPGSRPVSNLGELHPNNAGLVGNVAGSSPSRAATINDGPLWTKTGGAAGAGFTVDFATRRGVVRPAP
jgi:hypothetical protein